LTKGTAEELNAENNRNVRLETLVYDEATPDQQGSGGGQVCTYLVSPWHNNHRACHSQSHPSPSTFITQLFQRSARRSADAGVGPGMRRWQVDRGSTVVVVEPIVEDE